jgi:CheY-like chemotaxis protein
MTALVVDNEPAIRALWSRALRAAGMQVLEASSATAALTLVRKGPPDLVVTDIDMPDMDGIELCRLLRADAALADLMIVVMTGAALTQRDEALAAGCDADWKNPVLRRCCWPPSSA